MRKEFTQTIQDKGGNHQAQAQSTERMTEILFGCGTKELYEGTGSRRGDRSSLPQDAQTAYIVGEVAATHQLKDAEITGNQQQRNEQIVGEVETASHSVWGIFRWNRQSNE